MYKVTINFRFQDAGKEVRVYVIAINYCPLTVGNDFCDP